MSSWAQGYVSDIEYTAGFYRELAPTLINHALLVNGIRTPSLEGGFTYCELGCGHGFSSHLMAAANPQGRFYAYDFNPAHIAGARALAEEAGLENIHFGENSFEELVRNPGDIPAFDYITFHGIYSWISAENRRWMVEFVRRHLKPGGVVYVSYNCLPGWSPMAPVQRLIREHADHFPGRSDQQADRAISFVETLKDAKARYFLANTAINVRLEKLRTSSRNYLAHEYLNGHWHPQYHSEVAAEMAEAKLTFAGSAALAENFPTICLTEDQRKVVDELPPGPLREVVKDFILNQQFRKDIYVRGITRPTALDQSEILQKQRFALLVPRDAASLKMQLPIGEVTANANLYTPVLDALARGPKSVGDMMQDAAVRSFSLGAVMQALSLLASVGQVSLVGPAVDPAPARRLNRAIARRARTADVLQGLAAPLVGSGIAANLIERLTYDALAEGVKSDVGAVAQHCWAALKRRNQSLVKDGKPLAGDEENLKELRLQIDVILEKRLPIWRTLQVI